MKLRQPIKRITQTHYVFTSKKEGECWEYKLWDKNEHVWTYTFEEMKTADEVVKHHREWTLDFYKAVVKTGGSTWQYREFLGLERC